MSQALDNKVGDGSVQGRGWRLPLLAIVLLGAALRCYGLARYSLWYDEACSILGAKMVDSSLGFLSMKASHELPLNALLTRLWHPLIGSIPGVTMGSVTSDFLVRLPASFFGVLCIALTFFTARCLLKDSAAALVAALLVCLSPFHIYYAQELRPHTLYVLSSTAIFFFTLKALEEDRTRHWVALVLAIVVAMYNYYFSLFFIVSINVFFVLRLNVYRKHLTKWIVCQGIAAILFLPALLMALVQVEFHSQASEFWFPYPTPVTVAITVKNFFAGYCPRPQVYWPLFVLSGGLMLLGLFSLRRKPTALVCLFVLAFVPMAGSMAAWYTQDFSFYTHRAQLPSSIPCFILAAAGLVSLKKRALTITVGAILSVLIGFALTDHYAQRLHPVWHHRLGARYKVDNRSTAHYIANRIRPGDYIGHASHFTMAPFEHHYLDTPQGVLGFTNEERQGVLASYPDEDVWEAIGWIPQRMEKAIDGAQRVWYVSSWWDPFDHVPIVCQFRDWFDAHAIRMDRAQFDGIATYLYDFDPELLSSVRVNQVADYGGDVIRHYAFPRTEKFRALREEWESNFVRQFPLDLSSRTSAYGVAFEVEIVEDPPASHDALMAAYPDYSILAESSDPPVTVMAGLPLSFQREYVCRIRLVNETDVPRTIEGRVYESSGAIEALAFTRDLDSDVWRPSESHFDRNAFWARLDRVTTRGSIRTNVHLDAGRYAFLIRYLQENNPANQSRGRLRAEIRYADGRTELIGVVDGNDPSGAGGWVWFKAGEILSDGNPFTLELTAENADNLPMAHFDIERVVFIPADESQGNAPAETAFFKVTLQPHGEKSVTFSGHPGGPGPRRIDIEFHDSESGQFRNLYFHLPSRAGN